jgi:hypothetical protein
MMGNDISWQERRSYGEWFSGSFSRERSSGERFYWVMAWAAFSAAWRAPSM